MRDTSHSEPIVNTVLLYSVYVAVLDGSNKQCLHPLVVWLGRFDYFVRQRGMPITNGGPIPCSQTWIPCVQSFSLWVMEMWARICFLVFWEISATATRVAAPFTWLFFAHQQNSTEHFALCIPRPSRMWIKQN
jgi:hypothetical protein